MENPEKPKMRIVHFKEKSQPNEIGKNDNDNTKDSSPKTSLWPIDLIFLDEIKEIQELHPDTSKRFVISLKEIYKRLKEEKLEQKDFLSKSLRVLAEMYRFEVDENEKEKIKQEKDQVEFALRQLLLS